MEGYKKLVQAVMRRAPSAKQEKVEKFMDYLLTELAEGLDAGLEVALFDMQTGDVRGMVIRSQESQWFPPGSPILN